MTFIRSPFLLTANHTSLLVIDVQKRLVPHINRYESIETQITTLIEACKLLSVPVAATEQAPEKLGETVKPIRDAIETEAKSNKMVNSPESSLETHPLDSARPGAVFYKSMFSCREVFAQIGQQLRWPATAKERAKHVVLLAGLEAHVCVLQTALDLLANGFRVGLVKGATGSQNTIDFDIAFQRMQAAGCEVFSTEGLIFEIAETSKSSVFRGLSQLVRQRLHN